MHDLRVWPGVESDGHLPTTTPGKTLSNEDQMNRLAKVQIKPKREGRVGLFYHILSICVTIVSFLDFPFVGLSVNVLQQWRIQRGF